MSNLFPGAARGAQKESWLAFFSEVPARQREVLEVLAEAPAGLTAWEITDRLQARGLRRMLHAVRPRITELLQRQPSPIREVGVRHEPRTNRYVAVFALVKPGQGELFPSQEAS